MVSKLPLELRNIIYTYLDFNTKGITYGTQAVTFGIGDFDPNFHISGSEHELDSHLLCTSRAVEAGCYDTYGKPGGWLLNAEYVGEVLARAMAERFFSNNDFNCQVSQLEELLIEDRTGTGFKSYEWIRQKLAVGLATTKCNASERAWQSTENETAFLNGLYANLRLLTLLTRKEVEITIWLSTAAPRWEPNIEGERRFYNIMEAVRAPTYELMHAGFEKVQVNHTTMSTGNSQVISEEPYNWFALSKEEWEEEKSGRGAEWLPSEGFFTAEKTHASRGVLLLGGKEVGTDEVSRRMKQRWGYAKAPDAYKKVGRDCSFT